MDHPQSAKWSRAAHLARCPASNRSADPTLAREENELDRRPSRFPASNATHQPKRQGRGRGDTTDVRRSLRRRKGALPGRSRASTCTQLQRWLRPSACPRPRPSHARPIPGTRSRLASSSRQLSNAVALRRAGGAGVGGSKWGAVRKACQVSSGRARGSGRFWDFFSRVLRWSDRLLLPLDLADRHMCRHSCVRAPPTECLA